MLLRITTTAEPATDLGYLLHKHPDRFRTFDVGFGAAHVFFPEALPERCTAVLLVEVDAAQLVRRQRQVMAARAARTGFALIGSVNDRAFAGSSLLSVAIGRVFGSALAGSSEARPDLAQASIPLEVHLPVLSCRGDLSLVERLFAPLGFEVEARSVPLDPTMPEWGDSRFVDLTLRTTARLADVLAQLYVLLPVLDDDKHYWVDQGEIDKLLRRGGAWLADHPDRELITRRYLRHQRRLTREALDRIVVADEAAPDADATVAAGEAEEAAIEKPLSLHRQRLDAVAEVVRASGARTVVDVGCGEGRVVEQLLKVPAVDKVTGLDVSMRSLQRAADRLHLDTLSPRARARVDLAQSSFVYRDQRIAAADAVTAVEVVEHVDPDRLGAVEAALFGPGSARVVVVTTPNREHNVRFESLPEGRLRHRDHRFEWTRPEFASWCDGVAEEHGFTVEISGIGTDDPEVGPPTQMAVFRR